MELTQDDVIYILKLIQEAPVGRFSLQIGDIKMDITKVTNGCPSEIPPAVLEPAKPEQPVEISRPPSSATPASPVGPAKRQSTVVESERLQAIKAPILGIFYRRPEPTAPAYVEEGSIVVENTTVALIEVMKCFNPVKAGVKGRIVKVCVDNGGLVEYDQELFLVQPE